VEKELLIACRCMLLLISALVLSSCASVEDPSPRQGDVADSHTEKGKITLYRKESDTISVSPRSPSLVLQHRW
jgi:hypothetical protein